MVLRSGEINRIYYYLAFLNAFRSFFNKHKAEVGYQNSKFSGKPFLTALTGQLHFLEEKVIMELTVAELGQIEYRVAWEKQQNLVRARRAGEITDTLLLLEHPHTFTIGRKGTVKHLIANPERLKQLEVEVVETDRGGDITYHGPGQLVGYPLLDLRLRANDVHRYLRNLEDTIIQTLLNYGLNAVRVSGYTGVWLETEDGKDKIAAIGVKVSQGVTMHGFALNVNTDLDYFKEIIPCGITEPGLGVTSLQKTLGRSISMQEVSSRLINAFAQVFGYNEVKSLQAV